SAMATASSIAGFTRCSSRCPSVCPAAHAARADRGATAAAPREAGHRGRRGHGAVVPSGRRGAVRAAPGHRVDGARARSGEAVRLMRPLRIGIGGPVGSGKTALMDRLCRGLRGEIEIAAITNDIYTREDAEFLTRAGAL